MTADTPDEWLARETRPERKAIICHQAVNDPRISDRMSAGLVGGGGRWRLNLVAEGRMDVWEPTWEVGNRDAPQQRIWRVRYALAAENTEAVTLTFEPPEALIPSIQRTLTELLAFCGDHQIESFAQLFRRATECLTANDPFSLAYHKDLAPEGLLSLSAKRVLAASQVAWVFGGMGSWNDLGFEGHEQSRYERLSGELFAIVNTAIAASANSTCNLGWG